MKITKQFNIVNKYEAVVVWEKSGVNWYIGRGLNSYLKAYRLAKRTNGIAYAASSNSRSGMKAIQIYPKIRLCHNLNIREEAGLI